MSSKRVFVAAFAGALTAGLVLLGLVWVYENFTTDVALILLFVAVGLVLLGYLVYAVKFGGGDDRHA